MIDVRRRLRKVCCGRGQSTLRISNVVKKMCKRRLTADVRQMSWSNCFAVGEVGWRDARSIITASCLPMFLSLHN